MGLELDPNEVNKAFTTTTRHDTLAWDRREKRVHNHYFKDVAHLDSIDVYRVLSLFNVTDPCIQHAVKKLLVAGGRGAGKDINKDIQEAIDSLARYQEIVREDANTTSKI